MARATGTVLLTMGVMLLALLLLAGIGSYLGDPHDELLGIEPHPGCVQRDAACRYVLEPVVASGVGECGSPAGEHPHLRARNGGTGGVEDRAVHDPGPRSLGGQRRGSDQQEARSAKCVHGK